MSKTRLCSALLALSAVAAPALAADVSIVALPDPAQVASAVDLQVKINSITDLFAYNFSLSFDASLLQVTSITEGSFLSAGGSTFFDGGTIDNTAGTITFAFDTLVGAVPGVSGSGTLVVIHMNAIGTGTSALTFTPDDTTFLNSGLNTLSVQAINRTLQVASIVPEPTSYLLLAAGLAGMGAWRRRQAAAA